MEDQKLLASAFQMGSSWNSFQIENTELSRDVTPAIIQKNLKVFYDSYKITSHFTTIEDLICFKLNLEELPIDQRKKSKTKKKEKLKTHELKTHTFKIAVSIEDCIMFCNHGLTRRFRNLFATLFEATDLIPYDLFGSPPYELLLLYRQAVNCTKDFELQMEKITLDSKLESRTVAETPVSLDIGCGVERIPRIKKLTCNINNMSLNCADDALKDIQMGEIELEIEGPSLFDFYRKLAQRNYISSVPEWISACRKSGKTHRRIQYT